jgi:hypothetical protein
VVRLDLRDDQRVLPRREAHDVADLHGLPFRHDPVGIVELEPGQVLQPLVRVQTATVLAHLRQPRPDLLDRRRDVDRPGGLPRRA